MCILKWVSAVKPERVKLPVLKKKSPGINVPGLQRRPSTTQKCPILLAKKIYYKSPFFAQICRFRVDGLWKNTITGIRLQR